jgi:putative FmdB family regulatory protein
MPVYEYECPVCEKVFEVQQGMNDQPLKVCSVCGGEVRKLMSMSSFHLKGGGWYSDGYASGGKGKNGGETQEKSSPAEKESTGGEAKAVSPPCRKGDSGGCEGCPASS